MKTRFNHSNIHTKYKDCNSRTNTFAGIRYNSNNHKTKNVDRGLTRFYENTLIFFF